MPIIPILIAMVGVIIILFGLLFNIWWIWAIGVCVFLYPFIAIKVMVDRYYNRK